MTKNKRGAKPTAVHVKSDDYEDWTLDAIERPTQLIKEITARCVNEVLLHLATERTRFSLAAHFGDASDPTEVIADIFEPGVLDEDISWKFSFAEVVAEFIDDCTDRREKFDADTAKTAAGLRDALRKMADDLDAWIE